MRRTARWTIGLFFLIGFAGCKAGPTVYYHPNADFGAIRRIALLPLDSLSPERTAADKVQKILMAELLAQSPFEVVEPGIVAQTLREQRIENPTSLTPAESRKLGEALRVQAFLAGTVVDFGETRSGTTPTAEVTLQLRLVEAQSGITLWHVSQTRSGQKLSTRLFGVGGETTTEATRSLVREEIKTLR
jgi:hypothetical protein